MALKFTDALKKIDLSRAADVASGVKSSVSALFDRKSNKEATSEAAPSVNDEAQEQVVAEPKHIEQAKHLAASAHELQERVAQYIIENSDKLKQWYSDNQLNEKITKVMKKAGAIIIYPVMMLYNLMKAPSTSLQDKMLIVVPLAYFIMPADLIPDALVGVGGIGFADDGVAIMTSIKALSASITPEIQEQTKQQYCAMIGEEDTIIIDNITKLVQDNQEGIIKAIAENGTANRKPESKGKNK